MTVLQVLTGTSAVDCERVFHDGMSAIYGDWNGYQRARYQLAFRPLDIEAKT